MSKPARIAVAVAIVIVVIVLAWMLRPIPMNKPIKPYTVQDCEMRLRTYMEQHGDEGTATREEKEDAFREAYFFIDRDGLPKVIPRPTAGTLEEELARLHSPTPTPLK